jgi:hypothetical protein
MDNDDKKILKLINKEKPPEDNTPGVTPNDLIKESVDKYDDIIIVGWKDDHFKISWSEGYSPEEVYVQLELAKVRLLDKLYQF